MDTYNSFVGEDDGSGSISWTKLYSFDVPLIGEVVFEAFQLKSYFFPSAASSVSSAPLTYGELYHSYSLLLVKLMRSVN